MSVSSSGGFENVKINYLNGTILYTAARACNTVFLLQRSAVTVDNHLRILVSVNNSNTLFYIDVYTVYSVAHTLPF